MQTLMKFWKWMHFSAACHSRQMCLVCRNFLKYPPATYLTSSLSSSPSVASWSAGTSLGNSGLWDFADFGGEAVSSLLLMQIMSSVLTSFGFFGQSDFAGRAVASFDILGLFDLVGLSFLGECVFSLTTSPSVSSVDFWLGLLRGTIPWTWSSLTTCCCCIFGLRPLSWGGCSARLQPMSNLAAEGKLILTPTTLKALKIHFSGIRQNQW